MCLENWLLKTELYDSSFFLLLRIISSVKLAIFACTHVPLHLLFEKAILFRFH